MRRPLRKVPFWLEQSVIQNRSLRRVTIACLRLMEVCTSLSPLERLRPMTTSPWGKGSSDSAIGPRAMWR